MDPGIPRELSKVLDLVNTLHSPTILPVAWPIGNSVFFNLWYHLWNRDSPMGEWLFSVMEWLGDAFDQEEPPPSFRFPNSGLYLKNPAARCSNIIHLCQHLRPQLQLSGQWSTAAGVHQRHYTLWRLYGLRTHQRWIEAAIKETS